MKINENYKNLEESYLFSTIAKKVDELQTQIDNMANKANDVFNNATKAVYQKGANVLSNIGSKVHKLQEKAETAKNNILGKWHEFKNGVKDAVNEGIDNCKESYDKAKAELSQKKEDIEAKAHEIIDSAKGYICIEDNKPEGIAKLQELVEGEANIEVQPLKTKYPQGAERMLIYAVTGETINSSMLPADAGCIVDNVDTVVSIYEAVAEGKPLMQRIVTVTGDGVNTPSNFRAPVGMDFQELLDAAGTSLSTQALATCSRVRPARSRVMRCTKHMPANSPASHSVAFSPSPGRMGSFMRS